MKKEYFGEIAGKRYDKYTLSNDFLQVTVTNLGAQLTNLWVKNKFGDFIDVVLGFESLKEYAENTNTYFGATVGRNCNRIDKARFTLENKVYQMPQNEGENNLHSGPNGYQLREWQVLFTDEVENKISFQLTSPSGDQGFPGELAIQVTYQLKEDPLAIQYEGISDETTVFNLTNHSYFNLNGHNSGTILDHELYLNADFYTPVKDSKSIPTGEILKVSETPFDFTVAKKIGKDITQQHPQLEYCKGYDHNYVLNQTPKTPFAKVYSQESGIELAISTDLPGVQFYSGNFLAKDTGKNKAIYPKNAGLCLETQYFPNSLNTVTFKKPIFKKGETIQTETSYTFKVR